MTDSSRGTFHLSRGKNVDLSLENTMALIGGHIQFLHPGVPTGVLRTTVHPKFDMRRLVFSSKPIGITEIFQVHVTRRQYKKRGPGLSGPESWDFVPDDKGCTFSDAQQNMAIGFIAHDPGRLLVIPQDDGITDSWCYSPDVWMLSEDKAYHDGRKEGKHNLGIYKPTNDTIGCRVNDKGYLEFIVNRKNYGVVWSKPLPMDRPLWGFVVLPVEYKIQACFTYGEGHPPSYQSSVEQKDGDSVSLQLSEIKQKIADLEATMRKNSQEMHCMQQDLASSFQKQLGALRKPFVNEEGFQQDIQQGQLCTKKAAVND